LSRAARYLQSGEWNEAWAGQYPGLDHTVPFSEAEAFLQRSIADQEAERRRSKSVKIALRVLTAALVITLASLSLILGQRSSILGQQLSILGQRVLGLEQQSSERRQHQKAAITDASLSSLVNQKDQEIRDLETKIQSSSESGEQSA
jgi:hypothetical protein